MPRIPKWMANAMEKLFSGSYHPVSVSELKWLTKEVVEITFAGDFSKVRKPFIPGNVIEFRVSDTEFRHYTPSFFDEKEGICKVLFYVHGNGPGSRWVTSLNVGQELKLMGFGGKISIKNCSYHVVIGDETSIGLMQCMSVAAQNKSQNIKCILELDKSHLYWSQHLETEAICLGKARDTKGSSISNYLDDNWSDSNISFDKATFYLTGNARTIKNIKKYLRHKNVPAHRIQSEPYWIEGKAGL